MLYVDVYVFRLMICIWDDMRDDALDQFGWRCKNGMGLNMIYKAGFCCIVDREYHH